MGRKFRAKNANIWVPRELIRSKAFIEMTNRKGSGAACKVLFAFFLKRQMERRGKPGSERWVTVNNGELVFTYLEAEETYGITTPRFTRALDTLIKFGFVDVAYSGAQLVRVKNLYALSDRWRVYGTAEFKVEQRPKGRRWTPDRRRRIKALVDSLAAKMSPEQPNTEQFSQRAATYAAQGHASV